VDLREWTEDAELAPGLVNTVAAGMEGSAILEIAGHVRRLLAEGRSITNLTIGDFDPKQFPIPPMLREAIVAELAAGQTNYPPSTGMPELRSAIRSMYAERLGLAYGDQCVLVGSGARPPIHAAFATIVEPGEVVVYPVPSWNTRYYVHLCSGVGRPVETRPEDGFLPTLALVEPHLRDARMLVVNSPVNPTGTVVREEQLRELSLAIADENRRRRREKRRPLVLLYDQVYWQLTFGDRVHHTPVGLVPELAATTVMVDAISKSWAATGLRVGWAVGPAGAIDAMGTYTGHMGAWAPRAEQRATARLLAEPALLGTWMDDFRAAIERRLTRLSDGLRALEADGLPVTCIEPQGAIYLSVKLSLGCGDDEMRRRLLDEAGVGVVPFSAFGYPDGTGWLRMSVGAVSEDDCDRAVERIGALLRR
jgi:aspartate aminotransferase